MALKTHHRAVAAQLCAARPQHCNARRWLYSAAIVIVCLPTTAIHAQSAASPYERAEQLRAQLNAKPAPRRTRTDYRLVIDAYKVIYHGMPESPHAVDCILATAQVLEDEGRTFRDPQLFLATINEYEYLRQHYPSNPHRAAALLQEGRVEEHELRDATAAEEKYHELLTRYPAAPEAAAARKALAGLGPAPGVPNAPAPADTHGRSSAAGPTPSNNGTAHMTATPDRTQQRSQQRAGDNATFTHHAGPPARLSGIRQQITDTGVELVFDLSSAAGYRIGHATNPTRIYFDLDNTIINRSLTLHPMVVSADPAQTWLVHRIRAAQFTPSMARVVLEVDDSADAHAQLVPNPWRLIIEVRSISPPKGAVPAPKAAAQPGNDPPSQYASQGQAAEMPLNKTATLNNARPKTVANPPASQPGTGTGFGSGIGSGTAPADPPGMAAPIIKNASLTEHAPASTPAAGISHPASMGIAANEPPVNSNLARSSAAEPTSAGDQTLVRALGLKVQRVVIDAGHGGHDTGTIGPGGLEEKDVVLDIALRLGAELQQRLGMQVVYTRTNDTFVPLEERTAIANNAHADLFISIHGNSSPEPNVRGVETYYLSLTNQKDALDVAARENATSDESIHDLADIVKRITMDDKVEESRELAADVQQQLYRGLASGNSGLKDRGIKKAPFVVLIGANMPSILTEVSFLTDSKDARELRTAKYRQRVADSLYRGVAEYAEGLSGVHLASQSPPRKSGH